MMTGHMGSSGNMTGVSCWEYAGNMGPMLLKAGGKGLPAIKNPVDNVINENEMFDAVLDGKYSYKDMKAKEKQIFNSSTITITLFFKLEAILPRVLKHIEK